MLNEILTISGKPSLYKLLTRGRGALIVENIDETKKRMREVFLAIEAKYGKKEIEFDWRKASNDALLKFFGEIIPDFDRDRVYPSHIKKIAGWYDLLVKYNENDFSEPKAPEEESKQD